MINLVYLHVWAGLSVSVLSSSYEDCFVRCCQLNRVKQATSRQ